jgi:hypothetical protein
MGTTVEVDRPTISLKKAAPLLVVLPAALTSCVSKVPTEVQAGSSPISSNPDANSGQDPNPTETPPSETTPTGEADPNYPSRFSGFYFGSYMENGQTKIVGAVNGDKFEGQNPDCVVPTVGGAHESQINTLYSLAAPKEKAGYMVYENYLTGLFNATSDKSGRTQGSYNGAQVEFVDNVWQMQKDGQTLFLNPVVPNLAGHDFGYPVICEKSGQLMMALTDENGAIVDNTLQPAFETAAKIAKDYGYTGSGQVTSVSIMKDGRLEAKDASGNTLAYLRFLGKAETQILPSLPEGVSNLTVYNYETGKDEVLSPTFDESMDTYVWKNEKGEVRRFLDKETGRVFSQTESVKNQIIYQIDTGFGYEADLTGLFTPPDRYNSLGYQYLSMMWYKYPNSIKGLNENTKLVLKINHGKYDDVIDKTKISSVKDLGNEGTEMIFFWPVYDEKKNVLSLETFLRFDFFVGKDAIRVYTAYMLNYCPTSNVPFNSITDLPIGVLDPTIPKKPTQ